MLSTCIVNKLQANITRTHNAVPSFYWSTFYNFQNERPQMFWFSAQGQQHIVVDWQQHNAKFMTNVTCRLTEICNQPQNWMLISPSESRGKYSATSNNRKLVHWPLMGGLLHLVQQEGAWTGPQPTQAPPRYTKCNIPPINGQCTNHRIAV